MTSQRPFVAWDGEAVNSVVPGSEIHPYSLFGSSLGWRIKSYDLTTLDCLELMIESKLACPEAINFGFAFGYDVNMILRDLPLLALKNLKRLTRTRFKGFDIEYVPRKWLQISYGRKPNRTTIRIFDVFSFFGKGLAAVLREYGIGTEEQLRRIDIGKGERPNFVYEDITTRIEPYWETELVLMVDLMDHFRDILEGAGIFLRSWHGPGAIASYLLRTHQINYEMDKGSPEEILDAARFAYFGGRFEPFYAGFYDGPIYSADINSAYPYAHSRLPSLSDGKWVHELGRPSRNPADIRLGMHRIRYTAPYSSAAMPLPHRSRSGSVTFSNATEGWFHSPEAALVYFDDHAEFLESWIFEDDGSYPFSWIEDLYLKRLELKAQNDPTQIAFKLGPNSLYGQVAQRTGWEHVDGPPKWHQLEWAGAITSECRAMVHSVARMAGRALVSIDTDGVLSLRPFPRLPNGSGNQLGQWKVTEYSGLFYLQNGIYWLRDENGEWLPPKSRGIPRKRLSFDEVFPHVASGKDFAVNQHSFIGFTAALQGRMSEWRHWVDEPRIISFGGTGKRVHASALCPACKKGMGRTETLHKLVPVPDKGGISSHPHYLPWYGPKGYESPYGRNYGIDDPDGWPDLSLGRETLESRYEIMEIDRWGIFE